MNINQITQRMNALEIEISRQQKYILKHGASNDLNSDKQWEQYKAEANANILAWDEMKALRDEIKVAA